jgi:predicted nucleotidyltransferase
MAAGLNTVLSMRPTSHDQVNGLIRDLLDRLQTVFGSDLVGAYLYGSAAAGDFDPTRSDVDLVIACAGEVETRFRDLDTMHRELVLAHQEWNDRIDVIYLSAAALRNPRLESRSLAVVSPGEPLHLTKMSQKWTMNWYLVREQGVTLLGPPAHELIPHVTPDEFLASVRAHLQCWPEWIATSDRPGFHAYAVLTICRALYACRNGQQLSKAQAAQWASREFPEWAEVINQALEWPQSPATSTGPPNAVDFVNFAVHKTLSRIPGARR